MSDVSINDKVVEILKEAIQELNEQLDEKISYDEELRLIGKDAALDSMGIVVFVTIIEELIDDKFNCLIEIVSDKAFSREYSPFYSIGTLKEFVVELINEERAE